MLDTLGLMVKDRYSQQCCFETSRLQGRLLQSKYSLFTDSE